LKTVVKRKSRTLSHKRTVKLEPKLYESMFLVDSAEATADWDGVIAVIKNILEKAGAEIVSIKKWDDRKLAYEINGHSRGTYILCYFRAEGRRVRDIERDVQLSEQIMRVLILCAEQQTAKDIEKDLISQKDSETGTQKDIPATQTKKRKQKVGQTTVKADVEQKAENLTSET
jgi:small subunit ribosomal protein S6